MWLHMWVFLCPCCKVKFRLWVILEVFRNLKGNKGSFLCQVRTEHMQMVTVACSLSVCFTEDFERGFTRALTSALHLISCKALCWCPFLPATLPKLRPVGCQCVSSGELIIGIYALHWLSVLLGFGQPVRIVLLQLFAMLGMGTRCSYIINLKWYVVFLPRLTLLGLVGFSHEAFQL